MPSFFTKTAGKLKPILRGKEGILIVFRNLRVVSHVIISRDDAGLLLVVTCIQLQTTGHHTQTYRIIKKPPKCYCTSHGLLAIVTSCDETTSCEIMPSHPDVTWRYAVTIGQGLVFVPLNQKTLEMFFDLVTLTFDLWPWPSNSRPIPVPNIVTIHWTV